MPSPYSPDSTLSPKSSQIVGLLQPSAPPHFVLATTFTPALLLAPFPANFGATVPDPAFAALLSRDQGSDHRIQRILQPQPARRTSLRLDREVDALESWHRLYSHANDTLLRQFTPLPTQLTNE